jgi:hypothetical protein
MRAANGKKVFWKWRNGWFSAADGDALLRDVKGHDRAQ